MTRKEATQAVRTNPRDPDAWVALGDVLAEDGEKEKARECYGRALSLNPSHTEARWALEALDEPAAPAAPSWWEEARTSSAEPESPLPRQERNAPATRVEPPPFQPMTQAGGLSGSGEMAAPPLAWSAAVPSLLRSASGTGAAAATVQAQPAPLKPAPAEPPAPPKEKKEKGPKRFDTSGWAAELRQVAPFIGGALVLVVLMMGGIFAWTRFAPANLFSRFTQPLAEHLPLQSLPVVTFDRPEWLTDAEGLRWSNRFEEAEAALREATARPEDEALAQAALSLLLSDQLGRADESVAAAERAAELASTPAEKGYAAFALVTAMESQKQPPDGAAMRELANDARRAAGRFTYTQMARARAEAANASWSESMNAARDAVHTAGEAEQAEAWVALARATTEQGNFTVAEEAYGRALALHDYGPWQMERALLIGRQGRYEEAAIILSHGRSLAPTLPNGAFAEAMLAYFRHDEAGMEAGIAALAEQLPERGYADFLRGALHSQRGRWTEAIDAFRLAQLDPHLETSARAGVATAYSASGDCTRGFEEADALRKLAPSAPDSLMAQATARLCMGEPDNALALMRRGIDHNPANADFYHIAAVAATREGQNELAIDFFVKALQYAPTLTGIHPSISDLYVQGDDPLGGLRARFHSEIALELDPSNGAAHSAMGRLLQASRRPQQAAEEFEAALASGPLDAGTRLNFVEALLASGNTGRAIAILEEMAGGAERSPSVLYALARAYRTEGRYGEARDLMQEVVTLVGEASLSASITRFAGALVDPSGYLIPRDEMAGLLQPFVADTLQKPEVSVFVASEADGDWLTLRVPMSEVLSDEEQIFTASTVIFFGAMEFSRVTPALSGGVQAQIVAPDGTLQFAARVPAAIAREYSDGLISDMYLASSMSFQRDTSRDEPMTAERALRIGRDMAEHRHLPLLEEVPFNTIPREALAERFAEDGSDARTQEAMRAVESLYKLLGLIPPEESLAEIQESASVSDVAGFYEPDEGAFYLVTGDPRSDSVQDEITVAHEYQHAIQDQHYGLERFTDAEESDQQRAFQALAEGEATYSSFSYAYGKIPLADLLGAFSSAAQVDEERLEASPRYVRSTILFPYETGYAFVAALVQNEDGTTDWEKVNSLFENPPTSTEQVLHPDKYEKHEPPLATALPDFAPLGEGWAVQSEDVLGELSLNLLIEPFTGHAIASRASDGWGGDRYALLEGPEGKQAMVLRLRWDDAAEADEFWNLWSLYLRHRPTFKRVVDDPLADVYAVTRWWQGPDQTIFVQREDSTTVTVVVGPSRESLQPFADSLPGEVRQRALRQQEAP